MTQTFRLKDVIDSLLQMLQLENALLKKGEIIELSLLIDDKQEFSTILDQALQSQSQRDLLKPYLEQLLAIKKLSEENEQLLKAAKTGVTSAKTRLENIIAQDRNVGTYTSGGDKLQTHNTGISKTALA